MKKIPLTKGRFAIVDNEDYDFLTQWKWCYLNMGYACRAKRIGKRSENKQIVFLMHRVITCAISGLEVDHINGNGLDNRRCNLRLSTHRNNLRNQKTQKNKSSKYKGVCWDSKRKKWQAYIHIPHKKNLGKFSLESDAALAYNNAAIKHFGEFAHINDVIP